MHVKAIIGIIVTVIFSYLLGSVNFAIILSKSRKQEDVRDYGSGNAGMTNMLRTYGKRLATFTALGDLIKAIAAVLISRYVIFPLFSVGKLDAGYIAGVAVLIGHIFPIFFNFKGGKGVITSLGVMLSIDPLVFIIVLAITLPLIYFTRIVSIASITGAVIYPIITFIYHKYTTGHWVYNVVCTSIISIIVLITHRDNIKRLLSGTENRFGSKK